MVRYKPRSEVYKCSFGVGGMGRGKETKKDRKRAGKMNGF